MPRYPITEFDQPSNRLPASHPGAFLVNPFLDGLCAATQELERWNGSLNDNPLTNVGGFAPLLYGMTARAFCPGAVPGLPASNSPPIYPSGCQSSGRVAGYHATPNAQGELVPDALSLDISWVCGANKGLPIGGVVLGTSGGRSALFVECERADGSRYFEQLTPDAADTDRSHYFVTIAEFTPCPGCFVVPTVPAIPRIPPIPPGTPPVPRPLIPITINFPQGINLPPLPVPVIYAPISPVLVLNAPIVFRPVVNLPGLPSFAPDIELDLGGITIGGGGIGTTIAELTEIIVDAATPGAVCPDPCEPVDYAAIAQIVFDELDLKFPPFRPFGTGFTDYDAADSRQVVLPDFPTSIDIAITELSPDITSYSGGTNGVPVVLAGWYSFGDNTTVGERLPISYGLSSILVPKGARGFSYTLKGESLATVRVNFLVSAEPPN